MDLEKLWDSLESKPWQVKEEFLEFLQFILDNKIKSILEIGTHKGGSASGFLAVGCRVTSVDIVKQPEIEKLEEHISFEFYLREDFKGGVGLKDQYDMLYIDGNHGYEECLQDYVQYNSLVKKDGFVAFHDVVKSALHEQQGCLVWKVIEDILNGRERIDFITDGVWGGLTVIKHENM